MKEDLQQLITELIEDLEHQKTNKRLESYTDYKSKYTILKPSVKVEVALTDGRLAIFDVSDYFEGVIK